jgi:small subunit ribosomal protein S18
MNQFETENATSAPEEGVEPARRPDAAPFRRADGPPSEGPRGAGPRGAAPGAAGPDGERPKHRGGRRRRVCIMCADHIKFVDYKNASFLRRYVSERGRIETRRKTSACAKHQRALSSAIKRARHLALLPYTAGHVRGMSTGHR